MPLVTTDQGEVILLDMLVSVLGDELELHLFSNDHTPDREDTAADYDEADFSGYVSQLCENWSNAAEVADKAQTTADPKQFAHNGGSEANDIYGYYVLDPVSGYLLWAERDQNAPIIMSALGHTYTVTPRLTADSEYP